MTKLIINLALLIFPVQGFFIQPSHPANNLSKFVNEKDSPVTDNSTKQVEYCPNNEKDILKELAFGSYDFSFKSDDKIVNDGSLITKNDLHNSKPVRVRTSLRWYRLSVYW